MKQKTLVGNVGHIGAHMEESSGGAVENAESMRKDANWENISALMMMLTMMKMTKRRKRR